MNRLNKQESLEMLNYSVITQQDLTRIIEVARICKTSSIDLMIKYCDANMPTYSDEFSVYVFSYYRDWII